MCDVMQLRLSVPLAVHLSHYHSTAHAGTSFRHAWGSTLSASTPCIPRTRTAPPVCLASPTRARRCLIATTHDHGTHPHGVTRRPVRTHRYQSDRFPTVLQFDDIQGGGVIPPDTPSPNRRASETSSDAADAEAATEAEARRLKDQQAAWLQWARELEQAALRGAPAAAAQERPSVPGSAGQDGAESTTSASDDAAVGPPPAGTAAFAPWLGPMMAQFDPMTSSGRSGRSFGANGAHMGASNNWVVSGSRTKSGVTPAPRLSVCGGLHGTVYSRPLAHVCAVGRHGRDLRTLVAS